MRIMTRRLILRDLIPGDAAALVEQANNLNVSRYLSQVPHPYTLKDARWFIQHCQRNAKKDPRTAYELAIVPKADPKLIGVVSLLDLDDFQGTATAGYWLGESHWRKGIMTEALTRLITYAFKTLRLRRLDIEACKENKASQGLIKKMGFQFEGLRREFTRARSTGELHDLKIYGLLKEEWKKRKK